ncbi:hypothetical protein [Paludisphaera rhizosphaerae]|uniref:hypothetical protein n=1 Tax=Paludisphaera rhizosphaerae TaxID=2711216 RepID=UPI0013EE1CEB|nr:hypothetical protein [Paludisphaera rhizosphaerae]
MKGFRRPESIVLPENACVPGPNVIVPAPNRFTHEATRPLPYSYSGAQAGKSPDGTFPAGARVVLLRHDGGSQCRVVDGQGLYVEVEYDGLKPL